MGIKTLKLIPGQFKGLYQGLDENLMNPAYSPDMQNFDVSEGILSTRGGSSQWHSEGTFHTDNIKRLAVYADDVNGFTKMIMGTTEEGVHKWYYHDPEVGADSMWTQLLAEDASDPMVWLDPELPISFITYDNSGTPYLIIAQNAARLKKIYRKVADGKYYADNLSDITDTPADVTMHRDRIWTGGGDLNNILKYSAPYSPEDWTTAGLAGEIPINTWDGDEIYAVKNIFDDVVAFKKNTVWKVLGDAPDEYETAQVYAVRGTIYKDTICTDGNYCFFMDSEGLYQYTGNEIEPILSDEIKDYLAQIGSNIKCILDNEKLYIIDGYTDDQTKKHLVYDIRKKTIEVFYVSFIYDACEISGDVVYADGNKIYKLDDSLKYDESDIDAYWYFPESDLGYPNAEKELKRLSFTGWGTDSAGAAGGQVKFTIYYTGKNGTQKTKEKTFTLQTTRKVHSKLLYARGRLFGLKVENVDGSAINISNPVLVFDLAED